MSGSSGTRLTWHPCAPNAPPRLRPADRGGGPARPLLGWAERPHTGAVKPVLSSPAPRAPLPPIARQLAWTEWLLVVAVWLALVLTSVGASTENARSAGIGVVFRDFFAIQVIDWIVWLALLWPLFA